MTRDAFKKAVVALQVLMHSGSRESIQISSNLVILKYDGVVVSVERGPDDAARVIFGEEKDKATKTEQMVEQIYQAYPRRRDKKAARKAIMKAMWDHEIPLPLTRRPAFVLEATRRYAKFVSDRATPQDKIPYPATWFNRGSYLNSLEARKDEDQRTGTKGNKW